VVSWRGPVRISAGWAVGVADGAYDPCARPAPERLMRAWGMRVAHCSGAGRWRFLSGDGQAR